MSIDFNFREWLRAGFFVAAIQFLLYVAYWLTDDDMYANLAAFPGYYALVLFPRDIHDEIARFIGLIANLVIFTPVMVGIVRDRKARAAGSKS